MQQDTKEQNNSSASLLNKLSRFTGKYDEVFLTLSVTSFLGGFYLAGSLFFAGSAWYVRFFIVVLALLLSIAFLAPTAHFQKILSLVKGARIELRKIFWPSKDESIKTTLLVLGMVSVFAIFFSLVDLILIGVLGLVL